MFDPEANNAIVLRLAEFLNGRDAIALQLQLA